MDNPILINIWKILNSKKHVLLFVEDEQHEAIPLLMEWFEPITELVINSYEIKIKNETFLLVRKLVQNLPPMEASLLGDYKYLYINNENLDKLLKDLSK